jgi:hypothetical protein
MDAIENGDYETFLDLPKDTSFFKKWDQITKLRSEKLLLSFLLDHALSLVNEFDDFLDTIEEMEVFEIDSEDQLVLDIGSKNVVKLSEIEHVISAIQHIHSSCLEIKDKNLTCILDLWQESKESSVFDYAAIEKIKPGAFSRFKKIALANIEDNFLHDFDSARMLHDEEDSFYVGGASYTVANLLVSVSELGGRLARRLSERIPSVIGELKLNKNRTDDQVRLLIGSSFLIDYEDHTVVPVDDFETLLESSVYLTHSLISEGDYLVVSWQEPWEITEDSCFMVGLYKGEARRKLEDVLR